MTIRNATIFDVAQRQIKPAYEYARVRCAGAELLMTANDFGKSGWRWIREHRVGVQDGVEWYTLTFERVTVLKDEAQP